MLCHKKQKNFTGNDSFLRVTELLMPLASEKLISDGDVQVGSTDFHLWSPKLIAEAVSESSTLLDSSRRLNRAMTGVCCSC